MEGEEGRTYLYYFTKVDALHQIVDVIVVVVVREDEQSA